MIFWIIILIFLSCFYGSKPTIAQTNPRSINPSPQPLPEIKPLPPPDDLLQPPPIKPPFLQTPIREIPKEIPVTQFVFVGNTFFTSKELKKLLEHLTNKPISFAELLEAKTIITRLYNKNGFLTSGAFIPEQIIEDGIVIIQIIEGEVEEVEIFGLKRLNPNYIHSRIETGIQRPLNQDKLLEKLQLLRLDPLIAKLSAKLTAGTYPGLSRLEIEIEEAPAFSAQLSADNLRSPSVGTVRLETTISHHNLTGLGDRFNVTYYRTEGSSNLNDLSYTIPINSQNATISLRHRRTSSEIIEEPFNELDIDSNYQTYELSFRQPIYQNINTEIAVGLTGSVEQSKTTILDEPFPTSMGAEDDGEINISSVRFFQEYTFRTTKEVFFARSEFSLGINLFDATVNNQAPDSRYFSWRGQAQYLRSFAPETLFLIRSDIQLASRKLFPQEQFSLGGGLSVRGYPQDALLADNGIFLSSEFRFPILRVKNWNSTLQLTPFIDFGTVWNSNELELIEDTLSSVGLGLRFQVGTRFFAQLDWGIPLIDIDNNGDTLQEDGIYFYFRYKPF